MTAKIQIAPLLRAIAAAIVVGLFGATCSPMDIPPAHLAAKPIS